MAEDDNWRRRRADELFGNAAGATLPAGNVPRSLYRGTRDQSAPRPAPQMMPIGPEPEPRTVARPALHAPPPRRVPAAARSGGVSAASALRGLAVVVALFVAVAIGWLARGDGPSRSVAIVQAAPIAAPALPRPTQEAPVPPTVVAPVAPEVEPIVAPRIVSPAEPKAVSRSEPIALPARKPATAEAKTAEGRAVTAKPRTARADRPSFDCRRNHGAVVQMICADPVLATLDRRLAARFARLDASSDAATVLRIHRSETRFLNARQTCTSAACVERSYRQRLDELDSGE